MPREKDAKKDRRWRAADRLMRLIKKNFSEEEYKVRQELQAFLREREKSKWEVRSNATGEGSVPGQSRAH